MGVVEAAHHFHFMHEMLAGLRVAAKLEDLHSTVGGPLNDRPVDVPTAPLDMGKQGT